MVKTLETLTDLELNALRLAAENVESDSLREQLFLQIEALRVIDRSEKETGYYVDFSVPVDLRISDLCDDFNRSPLQAVARHPDGVNAIFFIVYVKDGMLSYMEASSTASWPKEENEIVFLAGP